MAYVAPSDFRLATVAPWCKRLVLTEGECTDPELVDLIATASLLVELELDDDFEPPNPDNDETIEVPGTIGSRLHLPRRTRSLTTVSAQSVSGATTLLPSTSYRLRSSLNGAGTAMVGKRDWLDSLSSNTWATESIELVGKFGWAAVPDDIKKLVALRVYDAVRPSDDPMTTTTQRTTGDASIVVGESREMARIVAAYGRKMPVTA